MTSMDMMRITRQGAGAGLLAGGLLAGGLLGLMVLTALERSALQAVIDITDVRKATRQQVVVVRQLDGYLQALDRANSRLLMDTDDAAEQAFTAARSGLSTERERLLQGARLVPEIEQEVVVAVAAVAAAEALLTADRQGVKELSAIAARVRASAASIATAQEKLEQLARSLYLQIDRLDGLVQARQYDASILRVAMLLLVLALLGGAYLLLWRESVRRQQAEQRLLASNEQLEVAVRARTAELEESRQRLRDLIEHLDESIEAERRRLARDVHDRLGQTLTLLKLHTRRLPHRADAVREFDRLLDEAVTTSRRIAAELRPPLLDDLGLAAALDQLARQHGAGASVSVEDDHVLTPRQAEQLYRIAQEAVTNVLRHAQAEHLHIQGHATDSGYLLSIEDDGVGMAATSARAGALGMLGMRERAHLAGGECRWLQSPSGGTQVEIRVPLAATGELPCASC